MEDTFIEVSKEKYKWKRDRDNPLKYNLISHPNIDLMIIINKDNDIVKLCESHPTGYGVRDEIRMVRNYNARDWVHKNMHVVHNKKGDLQ